MFMFILIVILNLTLVAVWTYFQINSPEFLLEKIKNFIFIV